MGGEVIKPGNGYFDRKFSEVILHTLPMWKAIRFTPNILTTLGMICSGLCLFYYYKKNYWSLVFLVLRIYFDYADGMMARKYKQGTKFGDYYDHVVDISFTIGFCVLTYILFTKHRVAILSVIAFFALVTVMQLGCIEKECTTDCNNASLGWLKHLCFNSKMLKWIDNLFFYIALIVVIILRMLNKE
jgi:phosphatidylglycerophosphate synthase